MARRDRTLYLPTFEEARDLHARVVMYTRGYAVQLHRSGPYIEEEETNDG